MYLFILLVIVLVLECIYYFTTMASKKKNNIEYYREIPSKEKPAIVGFLTKGNVDGNDIMATILDLWQKGYIEVTYEYINDIEQCILYDTGKERFMILSDFENYLLDELFRMDKRVVLDEFISSPRFETTFNGVGNMIRKRADIGSKHKVSFKRLANKINFITNYIVLGFAIFFAILYPIINNLYISIALGYLISLGLFLFIKNILIKNKKTEQLLISYSLITSAIFFILMLVLFLLDSTIKADNFILNICNVILCVVLLINLFLSNNKKWSSVNYIDYIVLIYAVISACLMNVIGLSISIIYIAHKIYINSPDHIYYSNDTELQKWLALKKYLNDFTVIGERENKEIALWNEYLIYAIAMGVNKKNIMEYAELAHVKLINKNFMEKRYMENIDF